MSNSMSLNGIVDAFACVSVAVGVHRVLVILEDSESAESIVTVATSNISPGCKKSSG